MKRTVAFSLATFFSLVSSSARAEEVGHAKFELPTAQWALLAGFDAKPRFRRSTTPVGNKVFYLADADGTIRALLRIASQDVRYGGGITWKSCPAPKPGYFTNDFGGNQHRTTLECLIVSTRFSPSRSANFKPDSAVGKAVAEKQLTLFNSGYSLRSEYGADKGAHLTVELVTRHDFKGLPGVRASTDQTHEVPAELIAWTESLHKAVIRSVGSFRGELALPPIEFKQ